jgi:hypothetical protein
VFLQNQKNIKVLSQIMENEYKTNDLAVARKNIPNFYVSTNET